MASLLQVTVLAAICISHLLILLPAGAEGKRPRPQALFVFGDSYSDTGDHDPSIPLYNIPWLPPYGATWPHRKGKGGGRYSDGKISTDILAELLGLPTPTTYRSYLHNPGAAPGSVRRGINFGSGGAGVFRTFDVPTIFQQVESFRNVTAGFPDVFTPDSLARSVVLLVNVGNDYSSFTGTPDELPAYSQSVVAAMAEILQDLYHLGLRNFIVSNIQPGGCVPLFGFAASLTPDTCATDPAGNALALLHNGLLAAAVAGLQSELPQGHLVVLDAFKAFGLVLTNAKHFGITNPPLTPCCDGTPGTSASLLGRALPRCGFTDAQQRPIYTVCADPTQSFFWDEAHPSQTAYTALYNLFFSGTNLTFPAPNLLYWAYTSNFAPKPSRADDQLPHDLLASLTADGHHTYLPLHNDKLRYLVSRIPDIIRATGPLTLFLPSDAYDEALATQTELGRFLAAAPAVKAELLLSNVVAGYYPAAKLLASRKAGGSSVRSLTGHKVAVVPLPDGGVSVGTGGSSGSGRVVKVVAPDLFVRRGQLVLHGTDAAILPPLIE